MPAPASTVRSNRLVLVRGAARLVGVGPAEARGQAPRRGSGPGERERNKRTEAATAPARRLTVQRDTERDKPSNRGYRGRWSARGPGGDLRADRLRHELERVATGLQDVVGRRAAGARASGA